LPSTKRRLGIAVFFITAPGAGITRSMLRNLQEMYSSLFLRLVGRRPPAKAYYIRLARPRAESGLVRD
jgi:hypothetical protein